MDLSLMQDIRFYARFLAMYVSKMKKEWVRKDNNFHRTGLKQRNIDQLNLQEKKNQKEYDRRMKLEKERPECCSPGLDAECCREERNR
jgi:hypothetical protein